MAFPLNLQYLITTSYLFCVAIDMRTVLDETLDIEVEDPQPNVMMLKTKHKIETKIYVYKF